MPNSDVPIWYSIMGPAGTPKEIVDKLNAKCVEIAKTEDMQARMRAISAALPIQTPAEIVAYRDADSTRNAEVIKAGEHQAGIAAGLQHQRLAHAGRRTRCTPAVRLAFFRCVRERGKCPATGDRR